MTDVTPDGLGMIYVGGAIKDKPLGNVEKFREALNWLENEGYYCISAITHLQSPHLFTEFEASEGPALERMYRLLVAKDIATLALCDTMVLIEDWEQSRGTEAEMHYAHAMGIPVIHLQDLKEEVREHYG